jgi:hypothetical protein
MIFRQASSSDVAARIAMLLEYAAVDERESLLDLSN